MYIADSESLPVGPYKHSKHTPNLHYMGVSALEYILPDRPIKVPIYLYARIEVHVHVVLSINPINTIG